MAEYTALVGNDPAPAAQVSYLTADHLGSPRVVTNQNGEVIKRTDWMAFGEEAFRFWILDFRFWIARFC